MAEMDGTVLRRKVGAFRCLPHIARYEPIELPENIHELIDLSAEELERMVNDGQDPSEYGGIGRHLVFDAIPNLRISEVDDELGNFEEDSDDEPLDEELLRE